MSVYRSYDPHFRKTEREVVNTSLPLDMLLSMATQSATASVVGGVGIGLGGTWYSHDGKTYTASKHEFGVLQTQAVYNVGKDKFAFVGTSGGGLGEKGGVGFSTDGGISFASFDCLDKLKIPVGAFARYGAFPSDTTWFVTGGAWPGVAHGGRYSKGDAYFHLSQDIRIKVESGTMEKMMERPAIMDDDTGYSAVIAATRDGGKTWELQFNDTGNFYFNQIDCASEQACMAVGEGFAEDGSKDPGGHIYATTNGGKQWQKIFTFGASSGGGAMSVKMLSATEAWAAMSDKSGGYIFHTTDGGKQWSQGDKLVEVGSVLEMSFIDSKTAYACAVTEAQDSTILAFGITPPPPSTCPFRKFHPKAVLRFELLRGMPRRKAQQGTCLQTYLARPQVTARRAASMTQVMYQSGDCSGSSKNSTEPTDKCLKSSSGGYFANEVLLPVICQGSWPVFKY